MTDVDVVIIGGRCAGATLGMLLARAGVSVVIVDRGSLPSDKPDSTHLVHPPALRRLRDWGVLEALEQKSGAPRIYQYGLRDAGIDLMAPLPPDGDLDFALAPRRYSLDSVLLDAAVAAGAALRDQTSIVGLVEETGAVSGVRLRERGGRETTMHARLVVGADGTRSTVADLVEARRYWEKRTRLRSTWAYWPSMDVEDVPTWRDSEGYGFAWPTNDGLTLVGSAWRYDEYPEREIRQASYFKALERLAPEIRQQIHGEAPEGRWMSGSVPNFFRASFGTGWALVGDAGYSRDPATASGITDAIRGADFLAQSILAWFCGRTSESEALAAYEARRNAISRPFYEYTCDFASLEPYPPDVREFLSHAVDSSEHASALTGLFAQTTDPLEFFAVEQVVDILREAQRPVRDWRLRTLTAVAGNRAHPWRLALASSMLYPRLGELGRYLSQHATPNRQELSKRRDPQWSTQ
ncbi:3-(3-hydroxy-phenyl)propionate/3-hydroxycinnamic acid hydroxylase [Microbacterium oxydans]|uniref:NAD(P)/FAD-dependent oxidoreductase n=1 Tax=Microbacterium oxydans TaxID=82380 RepID=UPI001D2A5A6A|nr:NAD(P)/FAD-dependent oxidoreductase [Microbacterium oxydans]CAH0198381.1 3-(3-hydroxy-phenyl)propionate/3-hydroxycinnamic acid hydroxylase [Microbacterium oxydans]